MIQGTTATWEGGKSLTVHGCKHRHGFTPSTNRQLPFFHNALKCQVNQLLGGFFMRKQEKLVQKGELPSGFEQREAENIIKAVWEAVAPMIRAHVEQIDSRAKTRIQIEHDEASRVREAADEALASVEKKERRLEELDEQVRGLQGDLAKLKGALEQANTENLRLAAENTQLHEALDKSLQEEAKAQASLQSMKRLLPFFCPFGRWVNFYVVLRVNSYVA